MTEKLDLYKEHKSEYVTPKSPVLVRAGKAKYLTITGSGAPASNLFGDCVHALYSVAFTLKMKKKSGGQDYKVCSLEGLWWINNSKKNFMSTPQEKWNWKLLIRTPDFITQNDLKQTKKLLHEKANEGMFDQVQLEFITEGLCIQVLHVGPYMLEAGTIEKMKKFGAENEYVFHGLHHEIYLSDPGRTVADKLRTILRMPVRKEK